MDLKDLGRELDQISAEQRVHQSKMENAAKGNRAGADFLASVIAGGIVGYAIDYVAGTLPWGMIMFIILGFVAGVYRANNAPK